jgi:hypothetical protein
LLLEDGRDPLEAVLGATKYDIGKDGKDTCDALIQEWSVYRKETDVQTTAGEGDNQGGLDYEYDIFLSYERGSMFEGWIHDLFLPYFKGYLGEYLLRPAEIFVKGEIFWRHEVSPYTQIALVHSRCLVAMCHPTYFHSQSCRYEMAVMLQRDSRLVVPVSVCDGKFFPRISKDLKGEWWRDYSRDYNGLVSKRIKDSPRYVELEDKIAKLAEEVAQIIWNIRPWSKGFFDNLDPDEPIVSSLQVSPEYTLPRW